MTEHKSKSSKWTLKYANHLDIYAIKLEGEGSLWLEKEELEELREFLNSVDQQNVEKEIKKWDDSFSVGL
jgi:hypothetical protein